MIRARSRTSPRRDLCWSKVSSRSCENHLRGHDIPCKIVFVATEEEKKNDAQQKLLLPWMRSRRATSAHDDILAQAPRRPSPPPLALPENQTSFEANTENPINDKPCSLAFQTVFMSHHLPIDATAPLRTPPTLFLLASNSSPKTPLQSPSNPPPQSSPPHSRDGRNRARGEGRVRARARGSVLLGIWGARWWGSRGELGGLQEFGSGGRSAEGAWGDARLRGGDGAGEGVGLGLARLLFELACSTEKSSGASRAERLRWLEKQKQRKISSKRGCSPKTSRVASVLVRFDCDSLSRVYTGLRVLGISEKRTLQRYKTREQTRSQCTFATCRQTCSPELFAFARSTGRREAVLKLTSAEQIQQSELTLGEQPVHAQDHPNSCSHPQSSLAPDANANPTRAEHMSDRRSPNTR